MRSRRFRSLSGLSASDGGLPIDLRLRASGSGYYRPAAVGRTRASSIDFAASNDAMAASAALDSDTCISKAFNESLRKQTEFLAQVADQVIFNFTSIDPAWSHELANAGHRSTSAK